MSSTRLTTRLGRLEATLQPTSAPVIRILWTEDCSPCPDHAGCDIDRVTGAHRRHVIHLSFGEPQA